MPYVVIGRIAQALKSLERFHAFYGTTFLSMKRAGVSTGKTQGWGSGDENALLEQYYRPPGAPPGKPFFVPFGKEKEGEDGGKWKNPKYSAGTLQRARTTDKFKNALVHPTRTTWGFSNDYVSVLASLLPKDGATRVKIPVLDLAAWLYRDTDLPADLVKVTQKLRTDFSITKNEYDELFEPSSTDTEEMFFFDEPAERSALIEVVGGVPEGPVLGSRTEEDLIAAIEHHVYKTALLALPADFVRRFYLSLKTQRFAVLAGRPGTGKTAFALAFVGGFKKFFPEAVWDVVVSVGPDFTESDVLGYEKIAGGHAATEVTKRLFLSDRPRDLYFVVLDEMNLAQVDHYLARLLPAIESDVAVGLPGLGDQESLPADTYFIGTVNSFLEEPTRLALSGPVKRRANVIEMPNTLSEIVRSGNKVEFASVLNNLLVQTREKYKKRQAAGQNSVLDEFRVSALDVALGANSPAQSAAFVDAFWAICEACAKDPITSLTFGVVQDVLDYVAMSGPDVIGSLDKQVAQKIVPQLAGPSSVARELLSIMEGLKSAGGHSLVHSRDALNQLLRTEDPSSKLVSYPY